MVEMGVPITYELLAVLDFNNVRKRMSVIGETVIEAELSSTVKNSELQQSPVQYCQVYLRFFSS